ncbi:uncharacterized protein LOC133889053 [Phragmites australis]|uniref:uncharacterized protein LOC133889053 n=1 Tax=Phragmites australis TaxID=29695 RepID=UPI002D77A766|nr:uncharacterized protein LOC133889053 [Phragmites australis]
MMARCPGAAAVRARWTVRSLAGAFVDLAFAWACLCLAAFATAAARLLALVGLPLPCTCARPHLPCLLAFLARYPARAIDSLLASLRSRFPFVAVGDEGRQEEDVEEEDEGEEEAVDGNLWRGREEREREAQCAELQRELEKERSASASATEEAMAMILRLQKEKSALEIEARQQRRTADERCAFYEDEVEELRDIVLLREREARALRKEVDAYRRLLGLGTEDDEDEEEMVTPHSIIMSEGEPSSSKSVNRNGGNDKIVQLGNDSVFSFKMPFLREELVPPVPVDHARGTGGNDDMIAVQTPGEVPVVGSKLKLDSSEDDGTETVEILPLYARSLNQGGDFHVDAAAGTEVTEQQTADEFQEVECGGVDKISHDHSESENDANIYDVHVVDDIFFSTEVKGVIGRSFSDATIQAEKLQTRAAADLLGGNLHAIKDAQDKIRLAANERRQSLQLQLLEDIANQLQEIKEAAEAGRHLYCPSKISKKN